MSVLEKSNIHQPSERTDPQLDKTIEISKNETLESHRGSPEKDNLNIKRKTEKKMTLAMKAKLPEYTEEDKNHGIVLEVKLYLIIA